MNLLSDILIYIRRIILSPSNSEITDNLLIDYVNRFWIMDVDAIANLFDLKTTYTFQTVPGVDQYNMPLYNVQLQPGGQSIGMFPVYQGFTGTSYINGIQCSFYTSRDNFFNQWPNFVQSLSPTITGNGTAGPYRITLPYTPNINVPINAQPSGLLRGHVDITGIIATGQNIDPIFVSTLNTAIPQTSIYPAVYFTSQDVNGNNVVVQDSGQFLQMGGINYPNYGLLMSPGTSPFGYSALPGGYSTTLNTINYLTGVANVTFPAVIPSGQNINSQVLFFNPGLPRSVLYYNNVITLRSVPDIQYQVQLNAYLSPAAFLNTTSAIPFGYMAEFIARGAARKIMADTRDQEGLQANEPFYQEQKDFVWKRSQRQFTSTRTETIYSNSSAGFQNNYNTSSLGN